MVGRRSGSAWGRPDGKLDDANVQVESEGTPGGIVACSDEPTLKSRTSTSLPIMMTIVNGTGGVINLFDLSPSGDRYSTWILPMPPIADGRSMPRMAATTRPLVVTDGYSPAMRRGRSSSDPRGSHRGATGHRSPLPGAEDALRQYIDGVSRGAPDYGQMTPWAADVARRTLRIQRAILAKLGAVQAVSFAGIGPAEDDIYQVKFDNGSAEWRIDLAQDGKIRRIVLGPQ
jgi:hypothetical protein